MTKAADRADAADPATSQAELQRLISLLRATLESTADGILVVDREGRIVTTNRQFATMWRVPPEVITARDDDRAIAFVLDQLKLPELFLAKIRELYATPDAESFDVLEFKDGRVFERYSRPQTIEGRAVGRVWSFRDITESRRLEGQLLQAQKLEAVGRLAGGIAHDFNNLLTTILGYSELILRTRGGDAVLAAEVGEIRKASERAASLTRQLLAFSRKQLIEPRVLDLNALVLDSSRMLRPLIGEDIELATELEPALSSVRADPVQIEQVIVNLAVNARDAMHRGGRISIATTNVELFDTPARGEIKPGPGRWVRLTVRDTGIGMDQQTQARVFEPFFTTKEKGKGTGLGLSTAYGIVKQSGGFIFVSSEPGRGATFEIWLPAVPGPPAPLPMDPARSGEDLDGRETVLLAEDEEGLRTLNRRVLEARGYAVLPASNAHEALDIAEKTERTVDILVTDVIMPGPSGHELAQRLLRSRPGLKVLFVSGYLVGATGDGSPLGPGANFLQKPFTPDALVRKVREILDT